MITCSEGKKYLKYADYLKSKHWAKIKAEYKRRFAYTCSMCDNKLNLHLHHTTYERVGNELLDDLVYLCQGCHTLIHKVDKSEKLTDLNTMIKEHRRSRKKKKPVNEPKTKQTAHHQLTSPRTVPLDSSLEFSHQKTKSRKLNKRVRNTIIKFLERKYNGELGDLDCMSDETLKKWYYETQEIK